VIKIGGEKEEAVSISKGSLGGVCLDRRRFNKTLTFGQSQEDGTVHLSKRDWEGTWRYFVKLGD